jgi:hypothetical protein
VRDVAYSILLGASEVIGTMVHQSQTTKVQEIRRVSGHNVWHHETGRLPPTKTKEILDDLLQLLQDQEIGTTLSIVEKWRLFAMHFTLRSIHQQRKTTPRIQDIVTILAGQRIRSWDALHMAAQYQATYYSFRMMLQIFRWISRTNAPPTCEGLVDMPEHVNDVFSHLCDLPKIADFFAEENGSESEQMEKYAPALRGYLQKLEDESTEGDGDVNGMEEDGITDDRSRAPELVGNPFAALAME